MRISEHSPRPSYTAQISFTKLVEKAQGVFLWVFLVIRSLLRGLSSADDQRELQQRIDELPPDLEAFFRHILSKADKVYQQQTAQIFEVVTQAGLPLPLVAYSYLD
jgi:hypothetical protein